MDYGGEKKEITLYKLNAYCHIFDYLITLSGYVGVLPLSKSSENPYLNMDKNSDSGQTKVKTLLEYSLHLRV